MHSTSTSTTTKPKRYYDSVNQQLAENSQTVRGVIKPNKNSRSKEDQDNPNFQQNRNISLQKQPSDVSHASSSSSVNNDSFYDEDDALSDYKMYPSCYNKKKIIVAPLGKTSVNSPSQTQSASNSPKRVTNHPK
ncbi:hypothetical protein M9Y10_040909 [Tritrichomonas musculus]|uniref:Uncharacterized protein n=1 Tax=Tritrichomonas musculus TaxID=1915356 RepID=A0ABR2K2X3_9EUKA